MVSNAKECDKCNGKGYFINCKCKEEECESCEGTGIINEV